MLLLIVPFFIGADQTTREMADEYYDQNLYHESIHLYKQILDKGDIDGITMYRYAYSSEQELGLEDSLTILKYAYAKYLLEQEGRTAHKYYNYAEKKLNKHDIELLTLDSYKSEEIWSLIKNEELFIQQIDPMVVYILLVFLTIFLLILFQKSKIGFLLSLLSVPSVSILASKMIAGNMSESTVYIVTGGLLLFMIFSGGYKHARKDGKADRRYKENPYLYTFSRNVRRNAALILPVIVILFLGVI